MTDDRAADLQQLVTLLAASIHERLARTPTTARVCFVAVVYDLEWLEFASYPHPSLRVGTEAERVGSKMASIIDAVATQSEDSRIAAIFNPAEYDAIAVAPADAASDAVIEEIAAKVKLLVHEGWRDLFVEVARHVAALGLESLFEVSDDFCVFATDVQTDDLPHCFRQSVPEEIRLRLAARGWRP